MKYILEYQGYQGSISYRATDGMIVGRIEAISDVVIFEADSVRQLKQEFETAVDCYLEFCQVESSYLNADKSYDSNRN